MKLVVQLRQARGLTQTDLARILRVHPSWVAHVEGSRYVPSLDSAVARRLCKFFGRPLTELLAEAPATDGERVPVGIGAVQNGVGKL